MKPFTRLTTQHNQRVYRSYLVGIFIFLCLISTSFHSYAQSDGAGNLQDLSRFALAKQKDSLKKSWDCPTVFKQKKAQKQYEEIWDARTEFISSAIDGNSFVYNKELYNYINNIVQEIISANKNLVPAPPLLLIDRSEKVNAYAIGGNVIAVNLGLISFAETREELALIIAHELSHNILEHPENAMKEKAQLISSDEYKDALNEVLDSEYGRLTKLKSIFTDYSFSSSRHNRYKESEADSMAIQLLSRAGIAFNANYFLRLDSADSEYRLPLQQHPKTYFSAIQMQTEEGWFVKKSKGLSSRKYNFSQGEELADSLKTHPACEERYETTKTFTTANARFTPVPQPMKDLANKMIVWNLYNNMKLTPALYRIMLIKDQQNKDPWYDVMMYNIFSGLYYADKKLARFNSIAVVPKEYISKDYYALQTFLEQYPVDKLQTNLQAMSSLSFWSSASADARGFKSFMHSINSSETTTRKKESTLSKDFLAQYPNSLYAEIAEKF